MAAASEAGTGGHQAMETVPGIQFNPTNCILVFSVPAGSETELAIGQRLQRSYKFGWLLEGWQTGMESKCPQTGCSLSELGSAVRATMEIQSYQWFPTVGPPSRHPFTPVDRM